MFIVDLNMLIHINLMKAGYMFVGYKNQVCLLENVLLSLVLIHAIKYQTLFYVCNL